MKSFRHLSEWSRHLAAARASRTSAQELVRRSEARSRSVIDAADAYIAMNAEGVVTAWNANAEAMFGWTHFEAMGAVLSTLVIPPAYRELHETGLRRALKTHEGAVLNQRIEITALRKDGTEFPVELSIWPLWDDEEATFNAFMQDITERHLAAAALEQETKLTTLLQQVAVASNEATDIDQALRVGLNAVCTAIGWPVGHALLLDEQHCVVDDIWLVNDMAYEPFQVTTASIDLNVAGGLPNRTITTAAAQWIPDLDAEPGFLRRDAAAAAGLRSAFAFPVRAGSDVVAVLEFFSPYVIDPDQRLLAVLTQAGAQLGRVVERRRTEAALAVARDAALEASQLKSSFLANMSHEIRTPMNGVLGMTSLLLDTTLDRRQREYAETVRVSAEALLTVINDILDFSKIEAGKLEIEQVAYIVRDAVEEAAGVLADRAHEKDVELATLVSPDVPAAVVGDPGRLRQLLLNLVGNAVKFTEHGEVVLRVTAPADEDQGRAARLRFEIVDTGIGIDADQLEMLFDPFSQADASTTRKFGGTGLGLAICAQLVGLMGGELGASSEAGKGSTFWFEIPLVPAVAGAAAPRNRPIVTGHLLRDGSERPQLLLVEDNSINQKVAVSMLERLGYRVDVAADGSQAVRALSTAAHPYVAVLMDCQMPVLDGYAATAAIRELESNQPGGARRTPIIAMTAGAMLGDREHCLAAGMDDYLPKPVRVEELAAALDRWAPRSGEARGDSAPLPDVSPARPSGVLDADAIQRLRELDERAGGTMVAEFVGLFLASSPARVAAIQSAVAASDLEAAASAAHALTGSCGVLGALALAGLCTELEVAVGEGDDSAISACAERLVPLYEQTCDALRRLAEGDGGVGDA